MFKPCTLFYADGYKAAHKRMLAPGTDYLYGSWICRSLKHGPKGATKVVSFGQRMTVKWLNDEFNENFFKQPLDVATRFGKDIALYLGLPYDGTHFEDLHKLGYLPIRIKALPEGVETNIGIAHMTFVNTIKGFAWLTLYLETVISSLAWKPATSATIALQFRRKATEWVMRTDPDNAWLIPFMCHDFSARGLSPWDSLSSGLGHATSFRGSDSLIVIPGARYFYNEPEDDVCINSVNASEHSVSTTKIFTVGEKQMILDWLKLFPEGILSVVADTFSLWKFIEYLKDPEIKAAILARNGKLVIRPDSGDPVKITTGWTAIDKLEIKHDKHGRARNPITIEEEKGVIELLWDIFGGTTNKQGYRVLDSHIGAIYGDSINLDRQEQIYERLALNKFAATNIVLGVGSYTYQMNSRDTCGWAAKGGWFEIDNVGYDIYKDPITDDGTKKSPKGLLFVDYDKDGVIFMKDQCSIYSETEGLLQVILEDGKLYNTQTLSQIRENLSKL